MHSKCENEKSVHSHRIPIRMSCNPETETTMEEKKKRKWPPSELEESASRLFKRLSIF